jgi:hypothetical protein
MKREDIMKMLLNGIVLVSMLMLASCAADLLGGEDAEEEAGAGLANAIELPEPDEQACNCDAYPQPCCCTTPIVLDVAGNGIQLTGWKYGVPFRLRPWQTTSLTAWTKQATDDGWLTLDLNENGTVDTGIELLGDASPQPTPPSGAERNGFLALAKWDKNDDQVIDDQDLVFSMLRVWQDKSHDGISQSKEIKTLAEVGVAGIRLDYAEPRTPDGHGNVLRYTAAVIKKAGFPIGDTAYDVTLARPTAEERRIYELPTIPPAPPEEPTLPPEGSRPPTPAPDDAQVQAHGQADAQAVACTYTTDASYPQKIDGECRGWGRWSGGVSTLLPPGESVESALASAACPPSAWVRVMLYNQYMGFWNLMDMTAGPRAWTLKWHVEEECEWFHNTAWRNKVIVDIPCAGCVEYPPWDHTSDSIVAGCSAFPYGVVADDC